MNKENYNSRAGKFEETVLKVFMSLAEAERDSNGDGWMTGNQLQEATNLSPTQINDAITILKEQGFIDVRETYGTAPFDFNIVTLNARGRLEFERRKSQEILKAPHSKENHKEWDLFVCHATEDKEEVVRPLVRALVNVGFNVWYDEFTLTIGDSLRRSIDKGLSQSKYGLVILSKNFFAKNWPQTELDGLAARERDGNKVILPVWHNVDVEYIKRFSPTLADRFAASTGKGIDYIVTEVLRVVKPSGTEQTQKTKEKSVISGLEQTLNRLRGKDKEFVEKIVKEFEFNSLKKTFLDVLDGVAFLDLPKSKADESVFDFIELAIVERNRKEGAELFKVLLNWFFQTVTPNCRLLVLKTFAKLTRLSYLKEVISETGRVSSFIAEFGSSSSYEIAGINTEILMNIQSLFSNIDLEKVVNNILANDQIRYSWEAQRYLGKILSSCEGRVDEAKMQELRKK